MSWLAVGGAAAGLAGSIYSSNKAADAAAEANSGDLPEWLKPYVVGNGPVPAHISGTPKINTNWLDYITQLGDGNADAPWAPMTGTGPHFNPDQTFTPEEGGGQYGSLPPDFDPYNQPAPPPPQQGGNGMDMGMLTDFLKQKKAAMFAGGEGAQYGNTGDIYGYMKRGGNDMSFSQMDELNELAKLLGR